MLEDKVCSIFQQLVSAVHYCHEKGVAQRVLNPHNILLDTQMNAKLSDFGLGTSFNGHQLSTFFSNPVYAGP